MRDINRIKRLLTLLETAWEKHPDLRLGQILINSIHLDELFYVEDEALFNKLEEFLNSLV